MNLRKIQEAEVVEKRVLVRVDFNVELTDGDVREKFKVRACKDTVDYLLSKGAKVALISHLGRPEGKVDPQYSLRQLTDDVERILGLKIKFIADCVGEKVASGLASLATDEVMLLENVRFYPGEDPVKSTEADHGAGKNEFEIFSQALAENFDVFVNDAFSVCHRDQASVTGVAKILPSFAGLWLQKEMENLDKVRNNPEHPAVAVIGGAKIATKLPLISNFEKNYDHVLVGGKVACEAIDQGIKFSAKVLLACDAEKERMDIGPQTIAKFAEIISQAKTVIWNGPMGKFEDEKFAAGTFGVLDAIIASGAYTLVGGGESVQVLEEKKLVEKISFVSTGGGAMLEYLAGGPMPGLEALQS